MHHLIIISSSLGSVIHGRWWTAGSVGTPTRCCALPLSNSLTRVCGLSHWALWWAGSTHWIVYYRLTRGGGRLHTPCRCLTAERGSLSIGNTIHVVFLVLPMPFTCLSSHLPRFPSQQSESANKALELSGTICGCYPLRVQQSKTSIVPVNPNYLPQVNHAAVALLPLDRGRLSQSPVLIAHSAMYTAPRVDRPCGFP